MSNQQLNPNFQRLHCLAKYLLENSGFLVESLSGINEDTLDDQMRAVMNMTDPLRVYYSQAAAHIPLLMELARVAPRPPRLGILDGSSAHDLSIRLATMLISDIYGYAGLEVFAEEEEPERERKVLGDNFPPVTFPCVFSDWPSGRHVKWVETQVDWEFARVCALAKMGRNSQQVVLRGREESPIVFSPDFRSCRWGRDQFTFTEKQAACIRVLLEARQGGTPDVSGITVLDEAESAMADSRKPRLRDLFRQHPAWRKMIVSASKGTYRLADPPE